MKGGIGNFLWKISVALYLIANGVLGVSGGGWLKKIEQSLSAQSGDFNIILTRTMGLPPAIATIVSVLAIIAGIAIILEMFEIRVPFRDNCIFIIAIIWAIYIIIGLVSWITKDSSGNFWYMLQRLAVHTMVLGSLMIASRKFDR